jgi:PPOX class probable F420-dependent enzyme
MRVIRLDDAARDAFVAEKRLGVLTTLRESGAPTALPLWYRWDGEVVEMFSERGTPKVSRLLRDPRATVLVANSPHESARWVSFEGSVTVDDDGFEASKRLLERYVGNPSHPKIAPVLEMFRKMDLVRLSLRPERIITYAELHD